MAVLAAAQPAITRTAPNKDRFCPPGTSFQTSRPLRAISWTSRQSPFDALTIFGNIRIPSGKIETPSGDGLWWSRRWFGDESRGVGTMVGTRSSPRSRKAIPPDRLVWSGMDPRLSGRPEVGAGLIGARPMPRFAAASREWGPEAMSAFQ